MTERSGRDFEQSRRQLRVLLSRRDFVHAGFAASVGAVGLAGCASGNSVTGTLPPPAPPPPPPGTIPSGFQSVTGSVTLPPGSKLAVTDLSVDVLTQTVPVSAAAGFTIGITADGPALALLQDKNGDGVLMSLFDSGLTPHTISSHTTAVALLYYATGAFLLPAAEMSHVLTLLDGDPAIAGLASAVASAVATDPHALANNAAPLGPAVTQAMQTIVGTSLRKPSAATSRASIHSTSDVPTLMLLNSAAEQNGNVVSLDTAAITVLISNTYRRPCKVYVYEVATQSGGTAEVPVSPATLVQGPFDLDSTQNLGLYTGLKAIAHGLEGQAPWTPVNLPPVPLTLTPATADKTTFQVVVLASSAKYPAGSEQDPPIFKDPRFANEIAKWRADTRALWAITVVGDLVLPILCLIGGLGAIRASRQTIIMEVTNGKFLGSAVFTELINTLHLGSMGELEKGLAEVVQNSVRSDVGGNLESQWLPSVKAVVSDVRAKAIAIESVPTIGSRMASGAKMFSNVLQPLTVAGYLLDGLDMDKVVHDFATSQIGASWEVALYRQKLGLIPQNPRVAGGTRVHFQVSKPANLPDGTYQYEWTQTSPFATLSAVDASAGSSITTAMLNVDLQTVGSDVAPISVLVVGYDISKTPRQEIGRAGTVVTILQRAEILPANAAVDVSEQRLFSVNVEGNLPSGVRYRWTVTGTGGTIGGDANGVITTLPQINYTGVTFGGTDVLHVDVIDPGNNLIATADATIKIAQASSIQFDVTGTWANLTAPANGSYSYTDFAGGRTAGTPGLDALISSFDQMPTADGVTLVLVVPTGGGLTTDQVFSKVPPGQQPHAGQFVLSLSVNLSDPVNSIVTAPGNSGSLTMTSVTQLASGMYLGQYTFSISNGGTGTIKGSGVGRWK